MLTSHSCSEEGLEDAANVLLQLSRGDPATRDTVLKLLLNGARQLGYTLCKQIGKKRETGNDQWEELAGVSDHTLPLSLEKGQSEERKSPW